MPALSQVSAEDVAAAKRFLVERVIAQAASDGVVLSKPETLMLDFSEATATAEARAAEQEITESGDAEYEAKIAKLLRRAHRCDVKKGEKDIWERSLKALLAEDWYLLIMASQAGLVDDSAILKAAGIMGPAKMPSLQDFKGLLRYLPPGLVLLTGAYVLFSDKGMSIIHSDLYRAAIFLVFIFWAWGTSVLCGCDK
jgi:hypothetical protein